jgi:hypothetical protein
MKNKKKLVLHRETLRLLSSADLRAALGASHVGGSLTGTCGSADPFSDFTCPPRTAYCGTQLSECQACEM